MRHANLYIDDKVINLGHLNPLDIQVKIEAYNNHPPMNITLTFFFTNHCYTEGVKDNENVPPHMLLEDHNGNPRKFCYDRYHMSLRLPDMLRQIHDKKCMFTGKQNWLVIQIEDSGGKPQEYHIYFNLKKHRRNKNGLFITIQSAYFKTKGNNTPKRKRHDRINFAMLARRTLADKSIIRPRKGRK